MHVVACSRGPPDPRSPTHLACLMAPSRVLKRAPHSSTTQWKCTLWRKSHCASQKSLVPNLAKADKQASYGRPQKRRSVGTDIFSLVFSSTILMSLSLLHKQHCWHCCLIIACYIDLNMQNKNPISLQLNLTEKLPFTFSVSKIQNHSETKDENH